MYQPTQKFIDKLNTYGRQFRARMTVGENEVTNIKTILLTTGSCGADTFSIGSVFASYVDIVLGSVDISLTGKEFLLEIGLLFSDDTIEYVPMGYFTVENPSDISKERDQVTIKAVDRITMECSGLYVPTVSFPCTIQEVLDDVEEQAGITIICDMDTSGIIETAMDGLSYRDVLGYIAGLLGGFCYADRDGNIKIATYPTEASVEVGKDRFAELKPSETVYNVESLIVVVSEGGEDADGNEVEGVSFSEGNGTGLMVSNPYMTQSLFDSMKGKLVGYSFYPGSVSFLGDPRLGPEDAITAINYADKEFFFPCMNMTQEFDGGLTTTISTPGVTTSDSAKGPIQKAMEQLQSDMVLAKEVIAKKITADQADIKYATIDQALILEAEISSLEGNFLSFKTGEFETLKSGYAEFKNTTTSELEALTAKIDSLDAEYITATELEAEIAKLDFATVTELNAVSAQIEVVSGDLASYKNVVAGNFTAYDAVIEDLKAVDAKLETALIGKAEISELEAAITRTSQLESNVAAIETLVNGNLTSDNIQSMIITGDKFNVEDGFIKNAMIESLEFDKITGIDINTTKITVHSDDGKSTWKDNTIQISDATRVRVQIGKDASGDYNIYIWDKDGNLMFDPLYGVQEDGIKQAIIRNDMVSETAAIAGSKLDIESVIKEVNGATTTIKSTRIYVDDEGQTLDAAFSALKTYEEGTRSISESNQTSIEAMQGQITTLISNTTIEKDGQTVLLKDAYNATVTDIDSIKTTISDHTSQINEQSGEITSLKSQTTTIETNLDGLTARVSETETNIAEVDSKFASYSTTTQMNTAIAASKTSILSSVSETYTTKSELETEVARIETLESWKTEASQKITKDGIIATVGTYYATSTEVENKDPFITGTQTASTGTWTGVAPFSSLEDGQKITYWLPYAGSGNATLNLTLSDGTTTGAIACYYSGTTRLTTHYPAGSVVHLTYRKGVSIGGTSYTGWWGDANADYYDRLRYQKAIKAAAAITAANIIVGTSSGYKHLKSGAAFDISYPILYASSAISSGSTGTSNYLMYSFTITTTQSITLTAYKAVYIKGTLSGSNFTPASTAPLTQTIPTKEDGYFYMLLGTAITSTTMYLLLEHPLFKYDGDSFKSVEQILMETQTLAKQTSEKFEWIVKSGTSETDFTLTDRTASLVAECIDLTGYVTFSDLSESGSTIINGDNITTGTISADRIDVTGLFAKDITATGTITGANFIGATGTFTGDVTCYDELLLLNTENNVSGKMYVENRSITFRSYGTSTGTNFTISSSSHDEDCIVISAENGLYVDSFVKMLGSCVGEAAAFDTMHVREINVLDLNVQELEIFGGAEAYCLLSGSSIVFRSAKSSTYDYLTINGQEGITVNEGDVTVTSGNATVAGELYQKGYRVMNAQYTNGYWGMMTPDASAGSWIRTTSNGIIPYQSGGASALGTSTWPFNEVHVNNLYSYNSIRSKGSISVLSYGQGIKNATTFGETGIVSFSNGTGLYLYTLNTGSSRWDSNILLADSSGVNLVPKSGGTFSGNLATNGTFTTGGTLTVGGQLLVNSAKIQSTSTYNSTTSTASNLIISSAGWFNRSTASSRRYKHDIYDLSGDLSSERLLSAPIRQYKFNEDYISKDDQRYNVDVPGFIAEELYECYPIAVEMVDGVIEDWNHRMLIPPMLDLIQKLYKRTEGLEDLTVKQDSMESQLSELREQIVILISEKIILEAKIEQLQYQLQGAA